MGVKQTPELLAPIPAGAPQDGVLVRAGREGRQLLGSLIHSHSSAPFRHS